MTHNVRLSLIASTVVAGVFAFWGGWTRRWISDDGLIVLRTVRNILVGNGPVFNVGERVEANTSTLWQYAISAAAWLTGARLEAVAMWLALAFTVAACAVATWATGRFWADTVLPFGVIIYLALPPARDFATSGLEWGLSIFWFAVWWALLVRWARPVGGVQSTQVGYFLAFWCGLSWLVRPELALYGGVTGIVLLAASPGKWWRILLVAIPLPAAYQIFRMGYYGLLTPHTAVAKSASDSAWGQGFVYLWDFVGPYALWLVIAAVLAIGIVLMRGAHGRERTIVLLTLGCGVVHVLYVLRVGGDFMHGRMLLLPLFALLLPVMVVPLTRRIGAVVLVVALWAGAIVAKSHPYDPDSLAPDGTWIVDERGFWAWATKHDPGDAPKYAEDFLAWELMSNWPQALEESHRLNAAQMEIGQTDEEPATFFWYPRPRTQAQTDLNNLPLSLYLLNLGMTSMNSGLDTRVLDTVGLATPLAARMPRDPEGRIGHDKWLPFTWQIADTAVDVDALPEGVDKQGVLQARAALRTPEIRELLASSREPMSPGRFAKNIAFALSGGRSLQLDDDPATYLDEETLSRIKAGEDVGLHGPQIAWPTPR
ncbi:hypothetical protein [Corynebacterium sanguinis]|uniref:hypothetical protein n=1 Tax=Corynebacterium sanguinis TaxID=2594913 RepID=UPI0011860A9D|nr:hypothetical protein [Corynebacterium sanguinis]QDR77450.1 hypothetical protein E3227_04855 [Corynebacterium sanguinis]